MDRQEIRLRCLELAEKRQGAKDRRGLIQIAANYFSFITAEDGEDVPDIEADENKAGQPAE